MSNDRSINASGIDETIAPGEAEKIGPGIQRIRNLRGEHGVPESAIEVSDFLVTGTFSRLEIQKRDQDDNKTIFNDNRNKHQDKHQGRDQDRDQDKHIATCKIAGMLHIKLRV